jgi:cytochrome c oxidase assembly protein subunit 11
MSEPTARNPARNARLAMMLAGLVVLMVGAAFAAVPLYRLFCQVTGFDGTPRRVAQAGTEILDRKIKVRFDTNVRDLPWRFKAEQVSQTLRIGQTGMAMFEVTNTSDRAVTGQAVYNVVPETAGTYFQKLECFCFTAQTIQPGQTVQLPMIYLVDPEITRDFETRKLNEITLSYTFFPGAEPAAKVNASATAQALGGERRAGL